MTAIRPNVLVFLADDLGYGDLAVYGNPDVKTPHLDRLAREGVRLDQHYSGSPLCAPARAALLTGRYNHRTGALSVESNRGLDRIALRETTIADAFKEGGYATGMIGKWHNGLHDPRYHPNRRGFDEFCGFLNGGMHYWDWLIETNGTPRRSDGSYLTDVFSREATSFIDRHKGGPWFLYVAYNAPHAPLEAPEGLVRSYLELGRHNLAVSTLYAMIERLDEGIGQILESLEARGLAEDTIVVFTSDNGPWLGTDRVGSERLSLARYNGPFRGMKQDVLEGGIRVPAIVRWPEGLPGGVEHGGMVHITDWLPTLAAAGRLRARETLPLDGIDQLSALRGENGQVPDRRFWQFNRYDPGGVCNAAMRDGNWKLYWPRIPEAMQKIAEDGDDYRLNFDRPHVIKEVHNPPVERTLSPPGEPELYNLSLDPREANDVASRHPARVRSMRIALENWFEEVEAERAALLG